MKRNFCFLATAPLAAAIVGLLPTSASAEPRPCEYVPRNPGPDGDSGTADDRPPTIVCGLTHSLPKGATLVGHGDASEGGTAIGQFIRIEPANAFDHISGDYTSSPQLPDASVGIGYRTRIDGDRNVAVGANSRIGGEFGDILSISDGTAIGSKTLVLGEGGTAVGSRASVTGANGIAIGNGASASGSNSIAVGAGSIADRDNSISVGVFGSERQITNVAAGTAATDAVNLGQLNAAVTGLNGNAAAAQTIANEALAGATMAQTTATTARAEAATAQNTADTALANAAAAQGTADSALANAAAAQATADQALSGTAGAQTTAITARAEAAAAQSTADNALTNAEVAQTTADNAQIAADTARSYNVALGESSAAALGGGSSYNAGTGAISPPSYSVQGQNYNDVGSAITALDSGLTALDDRLSEFETGAARNFRQANGGIAAAMALGGTMIVPDSDASISFNLATYRGEQGFSGALVVRAAPRVYISGGVAGSTVKGSTGGRVGVAFGL